MSVDACRKYLTEAGFVDDEVEQIINDLPTAESLNDFVKEIYFYPSLRFDGSVDRKDAVAISYLKKYQLQTFENSDTYVKFKVLNSTGF